MALKHILVDGYNFLHASAGTDHDWTGLPLEQARAAMVSFLADVGRPRRESLTVVFDGAGTMQYDTRAENRRGVEVIFSEAGVTADEVIRDMVGKAPDPRSVLVVTADREIRDFVRKPGARVIAPATFLANCDRRRMKRRRRTPREPPEKFRGTAPGEVKRWRRILGFDDEEEEG